MKKQTIKWIAAAGVFGMLFSHSILALPPAGGEGIVVEEPCNGAEGAYHTNPNGTPGGFVANAAFADPTVYIDPRAEVCSGILNANTIIFGETKVFYDKFAQTLVSISKSAYAGGIVIEEDGAYRYVLDNHLVRLIHGGKVKNDSIRRNKDSP